MGIFRGLTGLLAAAIAAVTLAGAGPAAAQSAGPACTLDAVDLRGDFGTVRFRAEIARTPAEQARGLMFRETLPRMAGMLFVYPREQNVAFWMRNTLIPLDMIFVDGAGRVVRVHENAVPLDETPIPGGAPTLAVLEINGGLAATIGIDAGDELRSPAMPQTDAAWPCN